MHRLQVLNTQVKPNDFWESHGLDHYMSDVAIRMRKATKKLMVEEYH